MERRFTFDRVSGLYGSARPSYPDQLFEDIAAFADLARGDAVLEIGCGAGQATRGFARQGLNILALDPGAELLRVARQSLSNFHNVEFVQATFEAWMPASAVFALIASAQAFHWVAPEVRFTKSADVLRLGGTLAVFGNVPVGLPQPLLDELRRIYSSHGFPTDRPPPENWYLPSAGIAGLFDESGRFGPVEHRSYSWKWPHTASSYTDFLRTRSDHQLMEPATREKVLADIADRIAAHGGRFEMSYETHLYMARRTN